jgi:catechol-2,3-dioxygenase
MPTPSALDHVALHVTDPAEAAAWCERVLGLVDAFSGKWGGVPRMMLASKDGARGTGLGTGLALFPKRDAGADGEAHLSHIAFRCTRSELDAWRAHLGSLDIRFTEEDHEVSYSLYFRGPDGVLFEVTAYE